MTKGEEHMIEDEEWKYLTDQEIADLLTDADDLWELIRTVEQKVKEQNE